MERGGQFTFHHVPVLVRVIPNGVILFVIDGPRERGTLKVHEVFHGNFLLRFKGERVHAKRFHVLDILV